MDIKFDPNNVVIKLCMALPMWVSGNYAGR
jgi:hypothetical protein